MKKGRVKICDELWSEAVKLRAGNKCEICQKTERLNSHHIITRNNYNVRYDLENGVCLCVGHHMTGLFSAHGNPGWFHENFVLKNRDWTSLYHRSLVKRVNNYNEIEENLRKYVTV